MRCLRPQLQRKAKRQGNIKLKKKKKNNKTKHKTTHTHKKKTHKKMGAAALPMLLLQAGASAGEPARLEGEGFGEERVCRHVAKRNLD